MIRKIAYAAGLAIALAAYVAPALAQESLGEKTIWHEQEQYLAGEGVDMKDRWGKDILASFDRLTILQRPARRQLQATSKNAI